MPPNRSGDSVGRLDWTDFVRKINLLLAVAVTGSIGGSACAMGQPTARLPHCAVSGADKLPSAVGGEDAICSAIRAALQDQPDGAGVAVEVKVLSASSLAARIRLRDGRTLPEQRMAVSDRQLNRGSIERFAAAIAGAVAGKASS